MPYSLTNFVNHYHKKRPSAQVKLAYLAGLVDGDGYVKVEKWGTVRLGVGMISKNVICWLHKTFGGTVAWKGKTSVGNQIYYWTINNTPDVFKLMIMIYPYLILKRKDVLKALRLMLKRMEKHSSFSCLKGWHLKKGGDYLALRP